MKTRVWTVLVLCLFLGSSFVAGVSRVRSEYLSDAESILAKARYAIDSGNELTLAGVLREYSSEVDRKVEMRIRYFESGKSESTFFSRYFSDDLSLFPVYSVSQQRSDSVITLVFLVRYQALVKAWITNPFFIVSTFLLSAVVMSLSFLFFRESMEMKRALKLSKASVLHDIRSPLSVIRQSIYLVKAGVRPSEVPIEEAIDRLREITESECELEGNQVTEAKEIICSVLSPAERTIFNDSVDTNKANVVFSRSGLVRALQNIVENARYASKGREIKVRLRRGLFCYEIVVENSGEGFPPLVLETLRKGIPHSSKADGYGIGLLSVMSEAKRFGAKVTVSNLKKNGAAVKLRLKRA